MPRSAEMPGALPAFLEWLPEDAGQPEAGWEGALMLPPALENARLLLIVEMPAMGAHDEATLLDPAQRRFLEAMTASIGLGPSDAAIATLAMRRAPGGLLDEAMLRRLGARMRHYLGLARPAATILFGDRTSRAVIGPQWSPGGDLLQKLNDEAGSVAVCFAGLDLLMSRPAAKARSWRALRLLREYVKT